MTGIETGKSWHRPRQSGYSLLELIVATAIFTLLMLSATAIFQMVFEAQRNAIDAQNTQESMRFVLEVMSKEVRSARRSDGSCGVTVGRVYQTVSDSLYFKNVYNQCVRYYLNNGSLMVDRGSGNTATTTPNEIKINNLKFVVLDEFTSQPRVSLMMDLEAINRTKNKQTMKLQTTLSSRLYD